MFLDSGVESGVPGEKPPTKNMPSSNRNTTESTSKPVILLYGMSANHFCHHVYTSSDIFFEKIIKKSAAPKTSAVFKIHLHVIRKVPLALLY